MESSFVNYNNWTPEMSANVVKMNLFIHAWYCNIYFLDILWQCVFDIYEATKTSSLFHLPCPALLTSWKLPSLRTLTNSISRHLFVNKTGRNKIRFCSWICVNVTENRQKLQLSLWHRPFQPSSKVVRFTFVFGLHSTSLPTERPARDLPASTSLSLL